MRRARAGVPGTERCGLDGATAGVILASVVDTGDLLEVIWVSAVASLVLVAATSLAILGVSRANAERREGRTLAATFYGALAFAGALVCAGGVVLGVSVMLTKG